MSRLLKVISMVVLTLSISLVVISCSKGEVNEGSTQEEENTEEISKEKNIEKFLYGIDINRNGIDDALDIVAGARNEIDNEVTYLSTYCMGGYPPEDEGVCTDVIWRALSNAGINLKDEMDKDIRNSTLDYKEGIAKADPNIDFRRVKNQNVYFKKYYTNLTTEVNPSDDNNLKEWQSGDIVVKRNNEHIAMISDKRDKDGVPYVLHNFYNHASEDNYLYDWYKEGKIVAHYRLNYELYK